MFSLVLCILFFGFELVDSLNAVSSWDRVIEGGAVRRRNELV